MAFPFTNQQTDLISRHEQLTSQHKDHLTSGDTNILTLKL